MSTTDRSFKMIGLSHELRDIIDSLKEENVGQGVIDMLTHALFDLEDEIEEEELDSDLAQ